MAVVCLLVLVKQVTWHLTQVKGFLVSYLFAINSCFLLHNSTISYKSSGTWLNSRLKLFELQAIRNESQENDSVAIYDSHQGMKDKKGFPNMETTRVVCTHVCVFYLPVSACPLCSKRAVPGFNSPTLGIFQGQLSSVSHELLSLSSSVLVLFALCL